MTKLENWVISIVLLTLICLAVFCIISTRVERAQWEVSLTDADKRYISEMSEKLVSLRRGDFIIFKSGAIVQVEMPIRADGYMDVYYSSSVRGGSLSERFPDSRLLQMDAVVRGSNLSEWALTAQKFYGFKSYDDKSFEKQKEKAKISPLPH
ncbi:MAG: hypothetical protein WC705_02805 [Candidatus Paceibacterota bacterium]|jgi:hypothetical protein